MFEDYESDCCHVRMNEFYYFIERCPDCKEPCERVKVEDELYENS